MKTQFILAAAAAAAILAAAPAAAQSKIASVDMETIVLSHPKAKENKDFLTGCLESYEKELAPKRESAKKTADSIEDKLQTASNEILAEPVRRAAYAEAQKIEAELRAKEKDLREEVAKMQANLAEAEHRLFSETMDEITKAVEKVAKAGKYDLVIDNSAMRSGAPIPLVVYANPADDITDKVIKELGGTKVDKKEIKE
ncbi:MAG: OmpH family outer membrane protein [Kiritimatiellaeota bacterium]|nr:OmpH family outer membrane protein [Kiritimatiellota bacterium]